jgi:hypothetical protein
MGPDDVDGPAFDTWMSKVNGSPTTISPVWLLETDKSADGMTFVTSFAVLSESWGSSPLKETVAEFVTCGAAGGPTATLTLNDSRRFEARWVRLGVDAGNCVFLQGIVELEWYLKVLSENWDTVIHDQVSKASRADNYLYMTNGDWEQYFQGRRAPREAI